MTKSRVNSKDISVIKHDFSTPEGAILCLEDAYRDKDIEAAVACKEFQIEGRLLLEQMPNHPEDFITDKRIAETAEVLELMFRKTTTDNGFPDMNGVGSTFPIKEAINDDLLIVTEVCYYPDGGTSLQRILVARTADGWRVLNPVK